MDWKIFCSPLKWNVLPEWLNLNAPRTPDSRIWSVGPPRGCRRASRLSGARASAGGFGTPVGSWLWSGFLQTRRGIHVVTECERGSTCHFLDPFFIKVSKLRAIRFEERLNSFFVKGRTRMRSVLKKTARMFAWSIRLCVSCQPNGTKDVFVHIYLMIRFCVENREESAVAFYRWVRAISTLQNCCEIEGDSPWTRSHWYGWKVPWWSLTLCGWPIERPRKRFLWPFISPGYITTSILGWGLARMKKNLSYSIWAICSKYFFFHFKSARSGCERFVSFITTNWYEVCRFNFGNFYHWVQWENLPELKRHTT